MWPLDGRLPLVHIPSIASSAITFSHRIACICIAHTVTSFILSAHWLQWSANLGSDTRRNGWVRQIGTRRWLLTFAFVHILGCGAAPWCIIVEWQAFFAVLAVGVVSAGAHQRLLTVDSCNNKTGARYFRSIVLASSTPIARSSHLGSGRSYPNVRYICIERRPQYPI